MRFFGFPLRYSECSILIILLFLSLDCSDAVLETRLLKFEPNNGSQQPDLLLSQALFGRIPSMDQDKEPWCNLQTPPSTNPLLCDDTEIETKLPTNTILLIPRGTCSFQRKALRAQSMGAVGVLIYQTLAAHYSLNTTKQTSEDHEPTVQDIIFPLNKHDYDCSNGEIHVPVDSVVLDNPWPYDPTINDPVLTSSTPSSCDSHRFFLTSLPDSHNDPSSYQACCAWDLPMEMGPDYTLYNTTTKDDAAAVEVTIPAAYVTLRQYPQLQQAISTRVKLVERWHPTWNISAVLIWALGVAVAAWAGHSSASEYHRKKRRLLRRQQGPRQQQPTPPAPRPPRPQEEVMDLTPAHVAGFIVSASTSLLVLFYFKIYGVVKVFYAFGCSTALAQVVLDPLVSRALRPNHHRLVLWRDVPEIGDITLRDTVSHGIAFLLGGSWLCLAFWAREPDQIAFFWILQNIFGACMCNVFLQVIRLNNLRVAALLLTVAFVYDIFFVFVTPHLFHGKSVMITVATSGGPPELGPEWCEKYPSDPGCQGGNPLPMLLAIPRLMDYRGGSSLLGLGDIVLPGLLLGFAARLDAAKEVIGLRRNTNRQQGQSYHDPCPRESQCGNGYFGPLVLAYGVGLAMANSAVYLMKMGQPALLYLVPCCLGMISAIGWRKQELRQLWDGPVWLDENNTSTTEHAPLPVSEDGEDAAIEVPSASQER